MNRRRLSLLVVGLRLCTNRSRFGDEAKAVGSRASSARLPTWFNLKIEAGSGETESTKATFPCSNWGVGSKHMKARDDSDTSHSVAGGIVTMVHSVLEHRFTKE